jgi:hypothetical protein
MDRPEVITKQQLQNPPAEQSGGMQRGWNEIAVDGRGSIYVNSPCFSLGKEEFRPGILARRRPTPRGEPSLSAPDHALR